MDKIGFVLPGGAIKGAYQIGVVCGLINKGILPGYISGISVGSLNSVLIVQKYEELKSKGFTPGTKVFSSLLSEKLKNFWLQKITSPDNIVKKKSLLSVVIDALKGEYNGLYTFDPLRKLIQEQIDFNLINNSDIEVEVGWVSLITGKLKYGKPTLERVLASSSIPFFIEKILVDGELCHDGGLVDNAPLKPAINKGCTHLHIIPTHPEGIFNSPVSLSKLGSYIDGVMEIVVCNTLKDDLQQLEEVNKEVLAGKSNKRYMVSSIYRPPYPLPYSLTEFTNDHIKMMFDLGYSIVNERHSNTY